MQRTISTNVFPVETYSVETAVEGIVPKKNFALGSFRHLKEPKRQARVCRETRASCRRCIPYARGRVIKRMQIKTFYLNDNITLVDASVLA